LEGIKLTAENDSLVLSATDLELAIIKTIKAEVS
jgi:DNA polymerase III sliding clamp (beta) subunit (PCNA family)